jgi:WD40 repeat protein
LFLLCPGARAEKQIAVFTVALTRDGKVARVAISPDGKQVAALVRGCADDKEKEDHVRLWELATKKEAGRLYPRWDGGFGQLFAYTPDGKQLVASSMKAVYVFDLKARKLSRTFTPKAAPGGRAALSGDGKTLVCGEKQVGVYEFATGKEIAVLKSPEAIYRVAVSRDGKLAAAAHRNGKVTVWDVPKRKALHTFEMKGGAGVAELAFSPDGKRLAAAGTYATGSEAKTWLYDLERLRVEASLGYSRSGLGSFSPYGVAFTPDGKRVVMAGRGKGNGIYTWEPATGEVDGNTARPTKAKPEVPFVSMNSMALSADGHLLVTGYTRVRVWDLRKDMDD